VAREGVFGLVVVVVTVEEKAVVGVHEFILLIQAA
jgi:hypothetical protein